LLLLSVWKGLGSDCPWAAPVHLMEVCFFHVCWRCLCEKSQIPFSFCEGSSGDGVISDFIMGTVPRVSSTRKRTASTAAQKSEGGYSARKKRLGLGACCAILKTLIGAV